VSENVEIVRRSFEAYASGGIEATLPFYAPDFVWDPGPEWVEDSSYTGHDGVRRLDEIFRENFEDYSLELHDVRAVGARVVALYEAVGADQGLRADDPPADRNHPRRDPRAQDRRDPLE
jgi:ketosteroid isomerase-like protein